MKIALKHNHGLLNTLFSQIEAHFDDFSLTDEENPDVRIGLKKTKNGVSVIEIETKDGETQCLNTPVDMQTFLKTLQTILAPGRHSKDLKQSIDTEKFSLSAENNVFISKATGESVQLTEKERNILFALYDAGQNRMDKKDLLSVIWSYGDNIETHTLETHIYRLRQKVEPDPANPVLIITDNNGYRLALVD